MSDFRVEALLKYWDHSAFVKSYSLYLYQKLEFIAFEQKLSGVIDKQRFEDELNYGISHKSRSYGDLYESVARGDRRETKVATTLVNEMKPNRLLERLNKLLWLLIVPYLVDQLEAPKTVTTKGSWEVFSGPEKVSDWELAFVESAITHQQVSYNQLGDGTYTSMGRTVTPVLAFLAPHENVLQVDPRDPFAASLMVLPPQYVQLADLEKRKSYLAQEHVWQPYEAMYVQLADLEKRKSFLAQEHVWQP
uniref:Putative clathrin assembly protein At2g25430 n=1 Tax=Tanacetum cinerariifolium TaxID=118510 RepID=A0A6L2JEB9_TANCI|nr:putative clathrin assembly protein At2g25430 [Tanacetum cinerariifolium]